MQMLTEARRRGENYMLERRLFRRKSTGEVIDPQWLRFSFPPWWHYDVLRGLDYLRDAGVVPDDRIAEAISIVERNREPDGRWPLQNVHDGADALRDGRRRRPAQSLEHAAGDARAAVVERCPGRRRRRPCCHGGLNP